MASSSSPPGADTHVTLLTLFIKLTLADTPFVRKLAAWNVFLGFFYFTTLMVFANVGKNTTTKNLSPNLFNLVLIINPLHGVKINGNIKKFKRPKATCPKEALIAFKTRFFRS